MLFISSEKLFLFSRFLNFCLNFLGMQKELLDQKDKVNLKIMTSQPGQQRITTHIVLNISRINGNQTMKFGQLIEYPKRNIFLFQTTFCFFKKALYQVKASSPQLDYVIFRQPSNQKTFKINCSKLYTIDPEISSILIFQIRLWEQFLQHIMCMIFQQKCSSC